MSVCSGGLIFRADRDGDGDHHDTDNRVAVAYLIVAYFHITSTSKIDNQYLTGISSLIETDRQ